MGFPHGGTASNPGRTALGLPYHLLREHITQLSSLAPMSAGKKARRSYFRLHNFVEVTYTKPTWCRGCGTFLWGIAKQGMSCTGCGRNLCRSCASKNTELEGRCHGR